MDDKLANLSDEEYFSEDDKQQPNKRIAGTTSKVTPEEVQDMDESDIEEPKGGRSEGVNVAWV